MAAQPSEEEVYFKHIKSVLLIINLFISYF